MKISVIKKNIFILILSLLTFFVILLVLNFTKNSGNVYEKINSNKKVNILIVGDSIGAGQGSDKYFWGDLFKKHLMKAYGVDAELENISIGATTTFCGYSILKLYKKHMSYDIVIICYGHNDSSENFEIFYEELVNFIEKKCPKCKIISILEASINQTKDDYRQKMNAIKNIALKHNIIIADTISAFSKSSYTLEDLTDEYNVHPNDKGQMIYFETVKNAFEKDFNQAQKFLSFEKMKLYKISDFKQTENLTYEIEMHKNSAYLGIDYIYHYGKNLCEIYVDDKKIYTLETGDNHPKDVKHRRITSAILDTIKINKSIKLKFKDKQELKFFNGLIVASP